MRVRSSRVDKRNNRVTIDEVHLLDLAVLFLGIGLINAVSVNPDVSDTNVMDHVYGILDRPGKPNRQLSLVHTCSACHSTRTPHIAQSSITRFSRHLYDGSILTIDQRKSLRPLF